MKFDSEVIGTQFSRRPVRSRQIFFWGFEDDEFSEDTDYSDKLSRSQKKYYAVSFTKFNIEN